MSDKYGFINTTDLMDDGDPEVSVNWYAEEDRREYQAACLASEDRAEMIAHGGSDGLWFDN